MVRESLRAYITYFNTVTLGVRNLDQAVTISVLKGGLQSSQFLICLAKCFPQDFSNMLVWAKKYASTEEAMAL